MSKSPVIARAIDHCVLPVPDLETARARYERFGFTVAPYARHPFGTENACVHFADGTFLEPLAIGQREDCEASARKGNVFTARDQAFRFRNGDNGFSALVMRSDDANADHKRFTNAGISAGKKLFFGRTARSTDGKKARVTFRLAFAADLRAPDAFFFTCERIKTADFDRSGLVAHANTVTGTKAIILGERNPTDFQYELHTITGQRDTSAHSFGMDIETGDGGQLQVLTAEGLQRFYGITRAHDTRGLRLEGIVLTVRDLAACKAALSANGVEARQTPGGLVIDPAPGQGAFLVFVPETGAEGAGQ